MQFSPGEGEIEEVLKLLQASRSMDMNDQHMAFEKIKILSQRPDYPCYLAYVLVELTQLPEDIRQLSGLLLKNELRVRLAEMDPQLAGYLQGRLLAALAGPSRMVRATVGTCVTTIVGVMGLRSWPALLPELVRCLDSGDAAAVDGALNALYKLCEDYPTQLDDAGCGRPLEQLLPRFIAAVGSGDAAVRRYALSCVSPFLTTLPQAMVVHMQEFLSALFARATDESAQVRKLVCRSLVTVFEMAPAHLEAHIDGVVNYMMHASNDADESVAIEACDFWNALCETEYAYPLLSQGERLKGLVPILLRGMVYSDDDVALMGADAEDSMPDYQQDLKPKFHKGTVKGGNEGGGDDDDDDDDDDVEAEWNLRKCSASALDLLSNIFQETMLPPLLDNLNSLLSSQQWKHREAAILAIGAVADGCSVGMKVHLPQLFPFLTTCLKDVKPLVRSISCWTLSRYSGWVVEAASEGNDAFFREALQGLLQQMMERNKRVQEAATSAVATLEEESSASLLGPFVPDIVRTFMGCHARYQAKNLVILYDAIGTLADSVHDAIAAPVVSEMLIPPLFAKWAQIPPEDPELCPLLECLASIVQGMGAAFQPFAGETWNRCVAIIASAIEKSQAAREAYSEYAEPPNPDLIMYPLDLMSAICDAIKGSVESLVADGKVAQILIVCGADPIAGVQQSAFALMGDVIANAYPHVRAQVPAMVPMLIREICHDSTAVANNASWALGELALKLGAEIEPFVEECLKTLVPIISDKSRNRNLRENVAITLGRLSLACPKRVAPHIGAFFAGWCAALSGVRDPVERESAYRGANAAMGGNPQGALDGGFNYYIDAVCSYRDAPADLEQQFGQILNHFKGVMGQQWVEYVASLPPDWRESLQTRFGV